MQVIVSFYCPVCGMAYTAVSVKVETGSWHGALKGAVISVASSVAFSAVGASGTFGYNGEGLGQLTANAIANGAVGGVMSVLGGGKFGHGFAAAGLSAFAKPGIRKAFGKEASGLPARVTARAVLGGTLSKISGGKFANGAMTAAFSQLFNEEKTLARDRIAQRAWDKVKDFGQAVADEVSFGVEAVANGVSGDYREGGVLGVVIGATGGHTEQGFMEQVNSDYASTSIVLGPLKNIDKTLTSLTVGGAITQRYGGYSFGKLLLRGPAPHLGTYAASARLAAGTTAINTVLITSSYEGGNYFGSALRAGINRTARLFE